MGQSPVNWWEKRTTVIALVLLSMVPLIWPPIPPLVDLPGHMGRYAVQLNYENSAVLRDFYSFKWALIGNLGIDLLIIPVAKVFGVELGTKLIVMTIPALTAGGLLWIAREVHGRVPPTAFFALPLAYGHPFTFGFVNFCLAMALALCAFALWLRLARTGKLRLRAVLFLIIGPLLWVTHTYGWATLGVLAFSAELIRQHDKGGSWPHAAFWAGVHCLCLAPPMLLIILWRSGQVAGDTGDWFNWTAKLMWFNMTLRDRWQWFDALSLAILILLIAFGIRDRRVELSRNLGASALFLFAVFLLLPRIVFGSAYADMRLTPFMIAIAVIAIRLKPDASAAFARGCAIAALAFFGVRTAATTASFAIFSAGYERALPALDHLPPGARVVSFVGHRCRLQWASNRMEHLPAIGIVRRQAFSNDQWDMAGAQLLQTRLRGAGRFTGDPSQITTNGPCPIDKWRAINWSLANLPRATFDYVWLLDPPPYDAALVNGMTRVWSNGTNALYRIDDRTQPPPDAGGPR